jgi:uncharacterized protein
MPGAISDSSTLMHVSMIGRLGLLREFFGEVLVPPAVCQEVVEEGQGRGGRLALCQSQLSGPGAQCHPALRRQVSARYRGHG